MASSLIIGVSSFCLNAAMAAAAWRVALDIAFVLRFIARTGVAVHGMAFSPTIGASSF
jgi:hypothetical protein